MSLKLFTLLSRLAIGWLFFYAGITKVLNSSWTSAGYLKAAKTFPAFYQWLASANMIKITDLLNEWGLTLLGVALILGIGIRITAVLAAVMMVLYYFPVLNFPMIGEHSYLVDEHIVYALLLLLLAALDAGKIAGVDKFLRRG